MTPVRVIEGRAIPFGQANVDTDVIIPSPYLKVMTRKGLGAGAFETIRAQPGNIFDDPDFADAPILIAGANFACGSSREHAAWALLDRGIRAVIAPSFSDIFRGNAYKNGIVPVVLSGADVDALLEIARSEPLTVDLETQRVLAPGGRVYTFDVDPFRKHCLLNGLEDIGVTLQMEDDITAFEATLHRGAPWIEGAATPQTAPATARTCTRPIAWRVSADD